MNDEFLNFLTQIADKLHKLKRYDDKKSNILGRIAKLTEEVGEFAAASLVSIGAASDKKLNAFKKEHLIEEFGDVIITACLLAKELDLDINESLSIRKKQLEQRWSDKK